MNPPMRVSFLGLALAGLAPAQQLRWQVPASGPSLVQSSWMGAFTDYNHDGYRDFLRIVLPLPTVNYV